MTYTPDPDDVKHELRELVSTFSAAVCGVEPVASHAMFATINKWADVAKTDDEDQPAALEQMLKEDPVLLSAQHRLLEDVDFGFSVADAYRTSMGDFQEMYASATSVDLEWLQESDHQLDFYQDALEKYSEMIAAGARIVPVTQASLLAIDCQQFKSLFLPAPKACLEVLTTTLPTTANAVNTALMEEIHEAVHKLESEPSHTLEYVQTIGFIDEVEKLMTRLEQDLKLVTSMYTLISRFEIPCKPEDTAEFETAKTNIVRLRDAVKLGVDSRSKRVEEFCDVLDHDISKLGEEVLTVRDEALDDKVFDAKAELADILAFTKQLDERMEVLQAQAATYKGYQKQFRVEVTKFAALEETHAEVKARKTLWDTVKEWQDLEQNWQTTPFLAIDAEEMSATVARVAKAVYALNKTLPENEVGPQLQLSIDKMKAKLPVITDLRNPALKARHWEKIDQVLGQDIPQDDSFTLELLDQLGAWDQADALGEVGAAASSEASLEGMLKKVEDAWKETELPVAPYRDSKDVFILGGLDDVQVPYDKPFLRFRQPHLVIVGAA